jgi:DNA repair exonuclease SbcCD nuclease subunit
MRIGFLADSHFVEGEDFEACKRIHQWIADDMYTRGVDLALHGGDVFDRDPTADELAAATEFFNEVVAHCPALAVRGNHDSHEALRELEMAVRGRWGLEVEQDVGMHRLWTPHGIAWVLGVGWGSPLPMHRLEHYLTDRRHGAPLLLVSHMLVRGAIPSVGQPVLDVMQRKGYVETPLEDLAATGADLVLLGHIHARQQWVMQGVDILYAGSARRMDPREIAPKCYVVADVLRPGRVDWARVDVPEGL